MTTFTVITGPLSHRRAKPFLLEGRSEPWPRASESELVSEVSGSFWRVCAPRRRVFFGSRQLAHSCHSGVHSTSRRCYAGQRPPRESSLCGGPRRKSLLPNPDSSCPCSKHLEFAREPLWAATRGGGARPLPTDLALPRRPLPLSEKQPLIRIDHSPITSDVFYNRRARCTHV